MKKLWLLVAAIAIVSCKKEATVDYAVISGKITNAEPKEMTLYSSSDRSFREKITIAEDGTFNDTIKKFGAFSLYQGRNFTPLHLEAGNTITINFDAKDHKNTLAITGTGSEISNYLLEKKAKENEIKGKGIDLFKKEEADYKKAISDIKTAATELIDSKKGISADYKAKEKRNINYTYITNLDMYKMYHAYYAKKKDFEPSDAYKKEIDDLMAEVSFNNVDDYNFSSSYKNLVSAHYRKKANELAKKDSISNDVASLKIYGGIKNEEIKNALIHEASIYGITYTSDLEAFYAAYKAAGSTNEKNNAEIEKTYNILKKVSKGNPSPEFKDYENYKGGTTSLADLKGKYVYIDVWATWCGPCKAEIPFLKKVEKQYHGKNITFLSISIDAKKDHKKWLDMVKEKELGGVQLFADNDWNSQFIQDYYIKGIPKFILLDPKGTIVTPNAPRPSNKKLVELFNELKI
ncbi:MAG: TlpA family protein disulfide reductase [Flavobacteriaceae bacterium]|nr:TlpA family protein disulfide reductase [Flavobacteriaceae bacterium]